MSGRQNRSITGNNRGQNTNTRQYGSTEQQKQSYANAVQQNVRQQIGTKTETCLEQIQMLLT